jgi:hypothetical protein
LRALLALEVHGRIVDRVAGVDAGGTRRKVEIPVGGIDQQWIGGDIMFVRGKATIIPASFVPDIVEVDCYGSPDIDSASLSGCVFSHNVTVDQRFAIIYVYPAAKEHPLDLDLSQKI